MSVTLYIGTYGATSVGAPLPVLAMGLVIAALVCRTTVVMPAATV